jgi:hypothetical protein
VIRLRRVAAIIVCCALGGCNAVGFVANAVGPPDVPAEYVLPAKPTIVVVKDLPDPNGGTNESEEVAAEIDRELKTHVIVPLISSAKVAEIRSDQTDEQPMSPAQIGRAAGADQVIYVELQSSSLDAGPVNDVLKGQISAMVRVIDAKTGQTLWPSDGSDGPTVSYETPMLKVDDETNRNLLRQNVCAGIADQVAKFFYKYKPNK